MKLQIFALKFWLLQQADFIAADSLTALIDDVDLVRNSRSVQSNPTEEYMKLRNLFRNKNSSSQLVNAENVKFLAKHQVEDSHSPSLNALLEDARNQIGNILYLSLIIGIL